MTSRDGTVYAARSLRWSRLRRALSITARVIGIAVYSVMLIFSVLFAHWGA